MSQSTTTKLESSRPSTSAFRSAAQGLRTVARILNFAFTLVFFTEFAEL